MINSKHQYDVLQMIAMSDLFITNDIEFMLMAGITAAFQISLFGIKNPFRWAPIGKKKKFIKKSDLINDIQVSDIKSLSENLLNLKTN